MQDSKLIILYAEGKESDVTIKFQSKVLQVLQLLDYLFSSFTNVF